MNALQVRTLIVDTIEALTPASQESHRDTYRYQPGLDAESGSRAFDVVLTTCPSGSGTLVGGIGSGIADPHVVEFVLGMLYSEGEGDRALVDATQIVNQLVSIPAATLNQTTYSGQVRQVAVDGLPPEGIAIDGTSARVLYQWLIGVEHDSRDP